MLKEQEEVSLTSRLQGITCNNRSRNSYARLPMSKPAIQNNDIYNVTPLPCRQTQSSQDSQRFQGAVYRHFQMSLTKTKVRLKLIHGLTKVPTKI